jgi:hypothetical protein
MVKIPLDGGKDGYTASRVKSMKWIPGRVPERPHRFVRLNMFAS